MEHQIVLDTNVLFAGLYSRTGAAFTLLQLVGKRKIQIHISVAVTLEYEDVLKRHSRQFGLTEQGVDAAINALCAMGHHHKIYYIWRPCLPDPKDDLFLELAVAAQCPYIVTHNLRDFTGSESFGIQALTPIQYLRKSGVHR